MSKLSTKSWTLMEEQNEIVLEEILLGYLRGSKKIELANIGEIGDSETTSTITVTFNIDKNFAKTLMKPLNDNSRGFFKKNQKNEY